MNIQGKFNPDNMQVLVSPERRQAIDTDTLLSALPITPRDVVADIGCGPPVARRIDPDTMDTKLRNMGFQTLERHALNADQYLMVTRT